MAQLKAVIDSTSKTIQFSGPGTFQAKEKIKSLGIAKWQPSEKAWVLVETDLQESDLHKHFQELVVEHIAKPEGQVSTPEVVQTDGVPDALSVTGLMARIKLALSSAFPNTVHVKGVINKINESRHMYLELRDNDDSSTHISCFIWQRDIETILKSVSDAGFELEPELDIMLEVSVGINPRRGDVSLTVKRVVVEYVLGKLAAERDKTNERLKKEGIFDKNKSTKLPFLPRRLGVLTSAGGTVINDFKNSLDEANFGFELFWVKVQVQGIDASKNIALGLKQLIRMGDLDAILIFRGGGSKAELSVFNDYELAKEVCLSPVPIVSAIGHQEDQSSVQDVSCISLGVPKDIGRYFADIVIDIRERVDENIENLSFFSESLIRENAHKILHLGEILTGSAIALLKNRSESLGNIQRSIPILSKAAIKQARNKMQERSRPIAAFMVNILRQEKANLIKAFERLSEQSHRNLALYGERVEFFDKFFSSHHPEQQLKLGYTIVRSAVSKEIFNSAKQLQSGDRINIQFHDDEKAALVE